MSQPQSPKTSAAVPAPKAAMDSKVQDNSAEAYRPKTRAEILAELMAEKMPPGRAPMLPRVYEYYTDVDEIDEDVDIFGSKGNLKGRRKTAVYGEGSHEDILASLYSNKSRKQRIIEAKAKYAAFRKKEEQERLREAELQRQEDLKFPTMMNWFYTDGYYELCPPLGINPELVEEYHKKEALFREELQKQRGTPNFTERFKKHFWPPYRLCCKGCFRTRGSYPDFAEVSAGTIPETVNFEKAGVEMLSNRDSTIFASIEKHHPAK